jgi:hypothetical protein
MLFVVDVMIAIVVGINIGTHNMHLSWWARYV